MTRCMRVVVTCLSVLIGMLISGCSTYVTVSSETPGADVYARGKGRSAYRWRQVGKTPATYNSPYTAEWIRVRWQDGTTSLPRAFDFVGKGSVTAHFENPSLAAELPSQQSGERSGVREDRDAPIALPQVRWSLELVAVAQFAIHGGVSPDEGTLLTETLRSSLVGTEYFRVVSRNDMETILQEQHFQRTDSCDDTQCLVEMGKILAVQRIVGATVGKVGSTFALSIRLVDVETGEIQYTVDDTLKAEPDALIGLVAHAGRKLALRYASAKRQEAM